MIPGKFIRPRAFPWNSARQPAQIDRVQDISGDWAADITKQYELGRIGILGFRKGTPDVSYSMRAFEAGSMAFWYDLANKATPESGDDIYIDLDDLAEPKTDIAAFLTDENDTFRGSIVFPKLRVNGFSLNIADPDAIVERNFDLVGEDYFLIDEKYFAYNEDTVDSGEAIKTIALSPAAVEYASGKYVYRVLRVRAGVVTELVEDAVAAYADNTWRYSAGDVIVQTCETGDLIKIYYVSSTAYTTVWTDNNADLDFLLAEYCEIRLKVGTDNRIYRLQTVGIDVAFDRTDYKEVGNSEVVQTGVNDKTVTISLNRYAEGLTLEDILASDNTFPLINPRNFAENIQMQILIYANKEHTGDIKIGYYMDNIAPSALGTTGAVQAQLERNNTLICDNLKISSDITEIAFV